MIHDRTPRLAALLAAFAAGPLAAQDSVELRDAVTRDSIRTHQATLQAIADANGGSRAVGTGGYAASVAYVQGVLEAAGYTVTLQPDGSTRWLDLGPTDFAQTAPTPTMYTDGTDVLVMAWSPPGALTAPAQAVNLDLATPINAESGCQASDFAGFVPGNIALIQRGACTFQLKAENAEAAGAVAAVIMNQGNTPERTGLIRGTLSSGYAGSIPVVSITYDLGVVLASTPGLTLSIDVDTLVTSENNESVIAQTAGGDPSNVVMVGAGLDSTNDSPGINTGGSGAATLLEIAVQLAELGVTPNNAVRFAFWSGSLASGSVNSGTGAVTYFASLPPADLEAIDLYLDFPTLGSPNGGRFVFDGDGSDGGTGAAPASAAIETEFLDYFATVAVDAPLANEPVPTTGSGADVAIAAGLPVGGLTAGTTSIKTPEQVALYGGSAGDPFDPCFALNCDTFDNVGLLGLDQLADAAAHAVATFAASTAPLRISEVEDLVGDVEDLGLPAGIESSLLAKLQSALDAIADGREGAAINQLRAFINQVEAKRGNPLTDAEADALIAAAQAIIDDLS